MAKFVKGQKAWNKGTHSTNGGSFKKGHGFSEEVLARISETQKRKGWKPPTRKGIPHSEESKKKISLARIGMKFSDETRKRMSVAMFKGGKHRGGYPKNWDEVLRRSVRERDNFTCQICFYGGDNRKFNVHHIDYNKNNCNIENLVFLCVSCHAKTNQKRDFWIEYFKMKNEGETAK